MTAPIQFRCAHCGRPVPFMDAGLFAWEHRNQCPYCLYSRHVMFGCARLRPCDGLMRPVPAACADARLLVQECEGCGFRWASYDEDWWAALGPECQTGLINLALAETERQNGQPAVIFRARREYRTTPPVIPARQLGSRARVARRP